MLDCTQTVTHVFFVDDLTDRVRRPRSEILHRCSWTRENAVLATSGKTMDPADSFKVRIEGKATVSPGDVMILGEVDISRMLSMAEVLKKYPESFTVTSVSDNTDVLCGYGAHIRVFGK